MATVYIDPSQTFNGDGTVGTPAASDGTAGAKNTWVGLTWTAGNTYAGQGGTSQTIASFVVAGSGTAGNPITITSYGTGRFRFNGSASYATATIARSYITWDNVELVSPTTNALYITGICSNMIVNNCRLVSGGTTTAGLSLEGASATTKIDNVTVTNNDFSDNPGWAVRVNDIPATNSTAWTGLTITDNDMTNCGSVGNTGAVKIAIAATSSATYSNITISRNDLTGTCAHESSPVHAIQVVRSPQGSAHEDRFLGIIINDNILADGGGGISVNNVGLLAGVQNSISGNTISDLLTVTGIILLYCTRVLVERNVISNMSTYAAVSYVDGSGVDIDLGNTYCTVRRNIISDCVGNVIADNNGIGISIFGSEYNDVYGNLLVGNRYGMYFGDDNAGVAGNPNYFRNNTIVHSLQDGIRTVSVVEQVNVIANNIIAHSARYGILSSGTGQQTLTTNIFWDNASGDYSSQTAGGSDILEDPQFMGAPDYRLRALSPAKRAGTWWGKECVDVRGRPAFVLPDIGCYQAGSGDQTPGRTAR